MLLVLYFSHYIWAMTAYIKCGWHGTLTKFLSTGNETILKNLQNHHIKSMKEKPGTSQINAWKQSVIDLKDQVKELVDSNSRSEYWNLILEYEIPRERGRDRMSFFLRKKIFSFLSLRDTTIFYNLMLIRSHPIREIFNITTVSHIITGFIRY